VRIIFFRFLQWHSQQCSRKNDNANGVPLVPHQTLAFDHVVTNAGNGYDHVTGVFTAPVAGHYAFPLVLMEPEDSTHPNVLLSLVKDDVIVDQIFADNFEADSNEQGSTHTVLHLSAGERVWTRMERGDGVRGSYWTVFTGYLVHVE
jgi:hypothetical protein